MNYRLHDYNLKINFFVLFVAYILCDEIKASGIGKCPKYASMENFNITRFSGRWYEIERSFYLLEITSSCIQLALKTNTANNYNVTISTTNRWTSTHSVRNGTALRLSANSSIFRYKVNTELPFSIARFLPGAGIYTVLYTDYDNVAVLWSCKNFVLAYTDKIWVFGRKDHITETMRIDIYEKIKQFKLDPERLMISKNENCTTF